MSTARKPIGGPTYNPPTVIDNPPVEIVSVESAITPAVDSFAEVAGSYSRTGGGEYLKHDGRTGDWSCGGAPVLPEDRWACLDVRRGYKYLAAGQPAEDYPHTPGQPLKTRAALGVHVDPDLWPLVDGARQDPVKEYAQLIFVRMRDGVPCTYDGLNTTGRRAVIELAYKITWQRGERGPTAKPILQLDSRMWQSGTRTVFIPVFDLKTWLVPDGFGGMKLESDADRPTLGKQLDDRNPW